MRPDRHDPANTLILTLILGDERRSDPATIGAMARATGIDAADLRLRLRREPPCILGLAGPGAANGAAHAAQASGGELFAPAVAEIQASAAEIPARTLEVRPGRLLVQPWRARDPIDVALESIELLVRGSVRPPRESRRGDLPPGPAANTGMRRRLGSTSLITGAAGAFLAHAVETGSAVPITTQAPPIELLDIRLRDGRAIRVDGRRFAFHVLGPLRGQNDRVNMDALRDLLARLAPRSIVDNGFALYTPGPEVAFAIVDRRLPAAERAFTFYARWITLVYRHMAGESGASPPRPARS